MTNKELLQLYQFPISHYCEKVRWALDYKGLNYKKINCLPGLHSRTTKKLAKLSSVPILKHGNTVVQGSSKILDYLDAHFPEKPLGFSEHDLSNQALEWERYADEHIGPHVRRIMYHQLLNHPRIVIPIFSHQGPWYSGLYFKITYSKLSKIMRQLMQINDKNVEESAFILNDALEHLKQATSKSTSSTSKPNYLVGGRFSRADLSVSALLAPLFLPKAYGINWPDQFPEDVESVIKQYQPHILFAEQHYAKHRNSK